MDVAGIGSLSSALSATQTGDAVSILVMKKAMEMQGQGALALVQAAAQTSAANPGNLGQNVDVKA